MNWTKWHKLKAKWDSTERQWIDGWAVGPGGNGDLIYNTARTIIQERGSDPVTNKMILLEIFMTLDSGQRWPDYMEPYIKPHVLVRKYDVTRDPWIMAICCAVHLGRYDLLKAFPPPFKRGPYRAWYNALMGERDYFRWWLWLPRFIFVNHTYVFWGFMVHAYNNTKQE
jgi:hypothetical protein